MRSGLLVSSAAGALLLASMPAAKATVYTTPGIIPYDGVIDTFIVPATGLYHVIAWGPRAVAVVEPPRLEAGARRLVETCS